MIVQSDRRPQLTRHLLQALGFGAIAAIALTGACGGNVVVDTKTGSGTAVGQGGSGSTYSTGTEYDGTNSSGTYGNTTTFEAAGVGGGFGSSAVGVSVGVGGAGQPSCFPTVGPGQYATETCVPNQDCAPDSSTQLLSALAQALGICDEASGSCCDKPVVGNIDCGPADMGNTCCFVVTVDTTLACP